MSILFSVLLSWLLPDSCSGAVQGALQDVMLPSYLGVVPSLVL